MSNIGVGKEVLSYCNKCKLTLAHIIVTMKTVSTIGKVECKTCKATHAYKDPSAVKATKTKTGGLKRKATKKTESISDMWLELVSKATSQSQKYSPRTEFKAGDVIDHPKFGPGFIDKLIDNDKIQVIFRHEIKTLIHNK